MYWPCGKLIIKGIRHIRKVASERSTSSWASCLATTNRSQSAATASREDVFQGCYFIHNLLSPLECEKLIDCAENHVGYTPAFTDYPPSYRNNDRLIVDDSELSIALFERAKEYLPQYVNVSQGCKGVAVAVFEKEESQVSELWKLKKLNPRLRACRYLPEQYFNRHRDGVFYESPDTRSFLTFMVYLDEPPAFSGGDTVFEVETPAAVAGGADGRKENSVELIRVTPRRGSMIVFQHDIMHYGAVCNSGSKHLLRSDVLYQRLCFSNPSSATGLEHVLDQANRPTYNIIDHKKPTPSAAHAHLGYVWDLLKLRDGTIASCSRDNSIKLWKVIQQGEGKGDGEGSQLQCISTLHGHTRSPLSMTQLTLSSASAAVPRNVLISVSRDRSIRIWNLDSLPSPTSSHSEAGCELAHIPNAHEGSVLVVAAVGRGSFVSGGADGAIYRWTFDEGSEAEGSAGCAGWTRQRVGSHSSWVRALIITPSGSSSDTVFDTADPDPSIVVSGGEDGVLSQWDSEPRQKHVCNEEADDLTQTQTQQTQSQTHTQTRPLPLASMRVGTPIMCLAALPGAGCYAVGGLDGSIHLCALPIGGSGAACTATGTAADAGYGAAGDGGGTAHRVSAHEGAVRALSVVQWGGDRVHTHLLSGGEDKYLRLWRLEHEERRAEGEGSERRTAMRTLTLQAELRDHEDFVKCVCATEDGFFASGSYDFQVKLRSVATLRQV